MKTVSKMIQTAAPYEVAMSALVQALQRTGGQVNRVSQDTVKVLNGNANVNFSFIANTNADVTLRPVPGGYEVMGYMNSSPNAVFWICLIAGLFLFFPWIINVMYFFVDPTQAYLAALNSIRL